MVKKTSQKIHHESKQGNEQLVAILCYFLVGIIWYFADKEMSKSRLANFHSKQVINLWILNIIVNVVIAAVPFIGLPLVSLANLLLLILWIVGLIRAVNMEMKEIPLIGQFAERYLKY